MTSLSETNNGLRLQSPIYYVPDDGKLQHAKKEPLALRVFYVALPFLALHQPFGRAITLTMDSIRTFSSFNQLINEKNSLELLKTAVAIAALAGTIFMHPLGLCISTLYDLGCDITTIIAQFQTEHNQEALYAMLSMSQHLFYLGTMLVGSLEIIALSMLLNMAIEICRSEKEFKKGHLLEAISHLLISAMRFSQAVPYLEKVAYKHDVQGKKQFHNLTKMVAKIRNQTALFFYSSARFLVSAHWQITDFWLETVSLCQDDQSSTAQKIFSTARSAIASIALLPLALGGLALGQTCHFSAFLLTTTPYIHLKDQSEIKKLTDKKLSVFQDNACLTAGGFARMFGGTVKPNEQRVREIAQQIKDQNPDLVCLQEVSDLKDAFTLYQELQGEFADFYLNVGATPFILQNNSGLFVASKIAIKNPKFHSFSDINGAEGMVNKGFLLFSTKIGHFITTHLSPSHDDLKPKAAEIHRRSQEQARILLATEKRSAEDGKPAFVLGDFNINWNNSKNSEYQNSQFFQRLQDQYNQNRKEVSDREATAETEYLIRRNWHHENEAKPDRLILDYFLSFVQPGRSVSITTRKIATFDVDNPQNTISDHAALITEIDLTEIT